MRTGRSDSGGYTSISPPRCANSPGISTTSTWLYPARRRCSTSLSGSIISPATHHARQVRIKRRVAQPHAGRCESRNDYIRPAGRDLPQRRGALLLDFRVRRLVLEWQHVVGGQAKNRLRRSSAGQFCKRANQGKQFVDRSIAVNKYDQRSRGASMQQRKKQGFASGIQSGDTCPPRAALHPGYGTLQMRQTFPRPQTFRGRKGGSLGHSSSAEEIVRIPSAGAVPAPSPALAPGYSQDC